MFCNTLLVFLLVHFISGSAHGQENKTSFRTDYSYIESVQSYYKIHTTKRIWDDAKRVCALEGATLWHPDNDDEARAVTSLWDTTQPSIGWVYVGMSDINTEGKFETVDGKSISEVYSKWEPGQPDNHRGKQDCVYLYKNGNLDDWGCSYKYQFICKKNLQSLTSNTQCDGHKYTIPFRMDYSYIESVQSFYKIHTSPRTWDDAKQVCALEGATFWHPDNDDEARAVTSFWEFTQPGTKWIYVGLSDLITEGKFETIDGKLVTEVYNKWELDQPNDYGHQQDCVYMLKNGDLNDWRCDKMYQFICKKSLQSLTQCSPNLSEITAKISYQTEYSYIESAKSFYKIHATPRTWDDAKQVCALEGATFWHPDNEDEARAVISFWEFTQPGIRWVYVGISDLKTEGNFETIEGKLITEVYSKWERKQPNDYGHKQDCVYMLKNGEMNDWRCDYEYAFICKKTLQSLQPNTQYNMPNAGGHTHFFRKDYNYIEAVENFYKIHTTPETCADAKRVCTQEGASFWYPNNDNEARAVILLWNTTQSQLSKVNVGISDEAKTQFKTIDGMSTSEVFNNWLSSHPDDNGVKPDCVHIYKNGFLGDQRLDDKYAFICKKSLQSLEWNNECNIPDLDYTLNKNNGKCYKVHTTPMNWEDSNTACRLEQSNLPVITSREETDYLVNLTESTPKPVLTENYYTGIYHMGYKNKLNEGWHTVKGATLDVNANAWWDNGQPGNDQCGSMLRIGRLISIDCGVKSFFVCEHELTDSSLPLDTTK